MLFMKFRLGKLCQSSEIRKELMEHVVPEPKNEKLRRINHVNIKVLEGFFLGRIQDLENRRAMELIHVR